MHFHLPKPLHGWREFAGEVAIIVIGVLIALAAQQIVDDWMWKKKAGAAREDIKTELQESYIDAKERLVVEQCINSQLDRLALTVTTAKDTVAPVQMVVLHHLPMIYRTPTRDWKQTSWNSAISDGVRPHLERTELDKLDLAYSSIESLRGLDQAVTMAQGNLSVLAHPIEVDPSVKTQLLAAIETERARTGRMALDSEQLVQTLDELGFGAPRNEVEERVRVSRKEGTLSWCLSRGLKI